MKPHVDQLLAVAACLEHDRGGVIMPTASGKSYVMKLLTEARNVKTLIVVPTLEIKRQMQETVQDCTNATVKNVDDKSLFKDTDYDMLLIDEAHGSASKTFHKLNRLAWPEIFYRYYFSATLFRNDAEEDLLLESIVGRPIFQLTYKDATARGYIARIEPFVVEVPKQATEDLTYQQAYSQLIVHNDVRNEIIAGLMLSLDAANKYTLCLVKEVAHGKILSNLTGLPFVSGEDEESRHLIKDFSRGEIMSLIGTEGVVGEGVDTKPCEYVLIAGSGKAKSAFMQKCGRAGRNYPGKESGKVILFRDVSNKYLLKHYNAQKKILLDEYSVVPVKLKI